MESRGKNVEERSETRPPKIIISTILTFTIVDNLILLPQLEVSVLKTHPLHEKAVRLAKDWLATEAELLNVIMEVEGIKLFRGMGYSSLHAYIVDALKLSPAVAFNFISVARKSFEVPELKAAVQNQELNINTARKIVPVLTPKNHKAWIEEANTSNQKDLEKKVASVNPEAAVKERIRPVCPNRLELKCGISEDLENQIKRIQDLESQRTRRPCSLEDALRVMAELYLEKKDPIKKAERLAARLVDRKAVSQEGKRNLPAALKRQVSLRDRGQCAFIEPTGNRCRERRWVDIHHKQPLSQGGTNTLENLMTLCGNHHKMIHLRQ